MQIIKQNPGQLLPEIISFESQNAVNCSGKRTVEAHIYTPTAGINANTGLMLVSHNWGGTWEMCWAWCPVISEKFNLITIDTNYYQSGWQAGDPVVYDFGLLQAIDCLQALYEVKRYLDEKEIVYNRRRNYAAGASGGGNISQMVNKLAPHTFGCIVDLCGMPGLTDEIAFGECLRLNAGYSRDPEDEKYLSPAEQEIRDFGNLQHLAIQRQCNPDNQVVIVHGVDDDYCSCADKAMIFSNMLRAGFKPDGIFVTPGMVDGIVLMGTGHALGDRAYIIAKYGQRYIAEKGEHVKLVEKDDFERRSVINYPVTGGSYIIDYSNGFPRVRFQSN
ncbi:MAG: DUF2920 family protein [Lentisphaerae bacterium]|nr:DUF2920 family protein [Lentisphaerota bacterium]